MNTSNLGIIKITAVPPPLELTAEEIESLADELVDYHATFADLYYRSEQAHWGYKYLQELMAIPLNFARAFRFTAPMFAATSVAFRRDS